MITVIIKIIIYQHQNDNITIIAFSFLFVCFFLLNFSFVSNKEKTTDALSAFFVFIISRVLTFSKGLICLSFSYACET